MGLKRTSDYLGPVVPLFRAFPTIFSSAGAKGVDRTGGTEPRGLVCHLTVHAGTSPGGAGDLAGAACRPIKSLAVHCTEAPTEV